MPRQWHVPERDPLAESRLVGELGIGSLLAAVLVNRGLKDPEVAHRFLHPKLEDLHDPKLLPDYEAATSHVMAARDRQEKIYIHGDYDVDGVTSSAILTRFLRKIGCDVEAHVPHRFSEGYGIHPTAVDAAHQSGAKLFLTCDCGVGAFEQIARARELGMKVVITDHHAVQGSIPEAEAVVVPGRTDSRYPFPYICGAGVAFKLCMGWTDEIGWPREKYLKAFLDLAAMGTVADVMPLVDENRAIVKHGLDRLRETTKAGLKALMQVSGVRTDKRLSTQTIGFHLGPRLNAVGRMDDSSIALDLLLTDEQEIANEIAAIIDDANNLRKAEQENVVREALHQVLDQKRQDDLVIVVQGEGWHHGVVGLVANKVVENFYRPAFVLSVDPQERVASGSARSIPGFDLAGAIHAARPMIIGGGGHAAAAGVSLFADRIDEFRTAMIEAAQLQLSPDDLIPKVYMDADIGLNELTMKDAEELEMFEPCGNANPEPVFSTRNVELLYTRPTKKEGAVQFEVRDDSSASFKGITFRDSFGLIDMVAGQRADIAFTASINEFNGRRSVQLKLNDLMPL